jgi:hypothetical protein
MLTRALESRPWKACATTIVVLAIWACDSANPIGPDNQLEVNAAADNFQFQISALDNVSEDLSYTWENTGTQATVDISQAITGGTAILTITDADGTTVHQDDLGSANNTDTSVGVAGTWRIDIELAGATGTINFRVQRKT